MVWVEQHYEKTDISSAVLAKLSKNEIVSMDIIFRICEVWNCNVGNVMDVEKQEKTIPEKEDI